MCGRFTQITPVQQMAEQFDAVVAVEANEPHYNVAPTQTVVGLVQPEEGPRELRGFRWGLIPSWAKDASIGNRMINARAETVAEKPAFRSALARRRCLVLADGFYEWKPGPEGKQPFYIYRADNQPLAFAGLWESWQPPTGERIESCTIITIPPNDFMLSIHDRMPAILDEERLALWLDPSNHQAADLTALLIPPPAEILTAHPVSTMVNNPRMQDAACIASLA